MPVTVAAKFLQPRHSWASKYAIQKLAAHLHYFAVDAVSDSHGEVAGRNLMMSTAPCTLSLRLEPLILAELARKSDSQPRSPDDS